MTTFTRYERQVVRMLLASHFEADQIAQLVDEASSVSCDHTGAGYFLTMRHPIIPLSRVVYDRPALTGTHGDIFCGFVAFLEGGTLTLECHGWGGENIPCDVRDRPLRIEVLALPGETPMKCEQVDDS